MDATAINSNSHKNLTTNSPASTEMMADNKEEYKVFKDKLFKDSGWLLNILWFLHCGWNWNELEHPAPFSWLLFLAFTQVFFAVLRLIQMAIRMLVLADDETAEAFYELLMTKPFTFTMFALKHNIHIWLPFSIVGYFCWFSMSKGRWMGASSYRDSSGLVGVKHMPMGKRKATN